MNLEAGNACGYCNAEVLGEPFPALFNIFQRYWAKSQTEVGGKSAGAVYLREESSAGHLLTSMGGGGSVRYPQRSVHVRGACRRIGVGGHSATCVSSFSFSRDSKSVNYLNTPH